MSQDPFVHQFPVWGDAADHVLMAVEDDDDLGPIVEQLWARRVGENLYEICCIPAFIGDLSLGDTVRASSDSIVEEVVARSGHWTLRAWSDVGWDSKFELLHELAARGALMETLTFGLLGIDAADDETAIRICEFLQAEEERGTLVYETGWK